MKLDPTQVAELNARTTYPKSAWAATLDRIAKDGSEGQIEADYPGVKPAHVAHMLRLTIKANAAKYPKLSVAKHPKYGVCVIRAN